MIKRRRSRFMNAMIAKGLAFAFVLIIATLVVVKQMNIDLTDPINLITSPLGQLLLQY